MYENLEEKLTKMPDGKKLYRQEQTILEVTELICQLLEEQNVTREELAIRLNKTKEYVTKMLDGRINLTIRMISDIFFVLNNKVHILLEED